MNFEAKKARILESLLEHAGIGTMVDVAAEVLNNPVYVIDSSFKLLAESKQGDEARLWEKLFPEHRYVAEHFVEVEESGIYTQHAVSDEPVTGRFSFSPYPFTGARIRDKNNIIGYAVIVGVNPVSEEDEALLVILCRALLFELPYHGKTSMQNVPYYNLFIDLLENRITKTEDLERLSILRLHLPQHMRLLYIEQDTDASNMFLYFVLNALRHCMPGQYAVSYQGHVILLMDEKDCTPAAFEIIKQCYENIGIRIGVSHIFRELWHMSRAFVQASTAIALYRKLGREDNVCRYDKVSLYDLFTEITKKNDLDAYFDDSIYQLLAYDEENKTELNKTVETYLECGRNINRAAQKMYLHKNTVYYRIQRAEEILGASLEDEDVGFSLQFFYRLHRIVP